MTTHTAYGEEAQTFIDCANEIYTRLRQLPSPSMAVSVLSMVLACITKDQDAEDILEELLKTFCADVRLQLNQIPKLSKKEKGAIQ